MLQEHYDHQKQLDNYQLNNTIGHEYPSHSGHQPSYSYRDQSLDLKPETQHTFMVKRWRFRMLRMLIQLGFVLLPFVGAWILTSHYAAAYGTYQQGSCTIESKDVRTVNHKDKHGYITSTTYYPRLFYEVHTANGTQVTAVGYDGPTARSYPFYEDAQTVINQYQIGQNAPCWYNPAAPGKAFLVFYGFASSDSAGISFWSFCGIGAFALFLYLLFDWTIWRLFILQQRGVVTQGTVIQVKQSRGRHGKIYYTSTILFYTREGAVQRRTFSIGGDLGNGTILPVCYDPLFPRYRRQGEWPDSSSIVGGIAVTATLTFIGLVILLVVWLIP